MTQAKRYPNGELRNVLRLPGNPKPVHPREKYWYNVGLAHGSDKRRKAKNSFPLQPPSHKGASYYERYREMYMLGFRKAREAMKE